MSNAQFNQFSGAIPVNGSLSQVIDTGIFPVAGLIVRATAGSLTAGNISLSVGQDASNLYPLCDATGTPISTPFSGDTAFSFNAIQIVAPYRYVRVLISNPLAGGSAGLVILAVKG